MKKFIIKNLSSNRHMPKFFKTDENYYMKIARRERRKNKLAGHVISVVMHVGAPYNSSFHNARGDYLPIPYSLSGPHMTVDENTVILFWSHSEKPYAIVFEVNLNQKIDKVRVITWSTITLICSVWVYTLVKFISRLLS